MAGSMRVWILRLWGKQGGLTGSVNGFIRRWCFLTKEEPLDRRNLRKIFTLLLVTSYLVLAVGSAWHVSHDHHHGHGHEHGVQNCLWCLAAATLLVLTVVFGIPRLAGMAAGFISASPVHPVSSLSVLPWTSRAPPVS